MLAIATRRLATVMSALPARRGATMARLVPWRLAVPATSTPPLRLAAPRRDIALNSGTWALAITSTACAALGLALGGLGRMPIGAPSSFRWPTASLRLAIVAPPRPRTRWTAGLLLLLPRKLSPWPLASACSGPEAAEGSALRLRCLLFFHVNVGAPMPPTRRRACGRWILLIPTHGRALRITAASPLQILSWHRKRGNEVPDGLTLKGRPGPAGGASLYVMPGSLRLTATVLG